MQSLRKTILLSSALCAGLLATGTLDVQVRFADNAASAFDLFGSKDAEAVLMDARDLGEIMRLTRTEKGRRLAGT